MVLAGLWSRVQVALQEQGLGPGEQVDADQGAGEPGLVDREPVGGEAADAGVFAGADAVLDAGVSAVAGIEECVLQLPDRRFSAGLLERPTRSSGRYALPDADPQVSSIARTVTQ